MTLSGKYHIKRLIEPVLNTARGRPIYNTASLSGRHGEESNIYKPGKKLVQYVPVEIEGVAKLLPGHSIYT